MKLIAGQLNGQRLADLNELHTGRCDGLKVAVAYANSDCMDLFKHAEKYKVPLTFYGRYDATVAVSPAIIEWFLSKNYIPNLECKLVPEFYHPKVIW